MPGEEVGSEGGVVVAVYAEPPPRLLALLRRHAPHSLPLLRRLEFTRFAGGITEHARILWASETALQASGPESRSEPESDPGISFTAGYLDLSRSKKTPLSAFILNFEFSTFQNACGIFRRGRPYFIIRMETEFCGVNIEEGRCGVRFGGETRVGKKERGEALLTPILQPQARRLSYGCTRR